MHSFGSSAYRTETLYNGYTFSTDGRTLLAGPRPAHGRLHAIDVESGEVTAGELVNAYATAGDMVVAATWARPTELAVLATRDLSAVHTLDVGGPVVAVAASESVIAAVTADPDTLVLVDVGTWTERRIVLPAPPTLVMFSADGSVLAVATGTPRSGAVLLIDPVSAATVHLLKGPRAPISSMALSAPGDLVAVASGTRVITWTIDQIRAGQPKPVTLVTAKHPPEVIGILPAGQVLVAVTRAPLSAIDPATASTVWSIDAFGPTIIDGDRVLSVDINELRELDSATGTVRHTWIAPKHIHQIAAFAGVVAASFGTARVELLRGHGGWPDPAGRGHDAEIHAVAFQGDRVVTTGADTRVCVWTRGQTEPSHTISPSGGRVGINAAGRAVWVDGDDIYTAFDQGVQRWSATERAFVAASDYLKADVTALLPIAGTGHLVAAARARRGAYGALYLLEEQTLEVVRDTAIGVTYVQARQLDANRIELRGDLCSAVWDLTTGDLTTAQIVSRDLSRSHHVTADGTTLIETTNRPWSPPEAMRGWLFATDLRTKDPVYEKIEFEPLTGTPALSASDLLAIPHANVIRIWDATSGTHKYDVPAPPGIERLWFFPDETALLASGHNGALHEIPL